MGNGELLFNGYGFQFGKVKRILEMDGGDGCTTVLIYLMPLNYTLKIVEMMLRTELCPSIIRILKP